MVDSAERLVRRWQRRPDGRVVDVSLDMTRVTLDVLERTIFTSGISRNPDALGRAITRYFEGLGRIDPVDIFGLPPGCPASVVSGHGRPSGFSRRWSGTSSRPARCCWRAGSRHLGISSRSCSKRRIRRREGPERPRCECQHRDLHRCWARDHRQRAVVVDLSDIPGRAGALAGSRRRSMRSWVPTGSRPRHLDELIYTRAVLEEAMRLYPPAPFLSRAAIADDRDRRSPDRCRHAGDDCALCAPSAPQPVERAGRLSARAVSPGGHGRRSTDLPTCPSAPGRGSASERALRCRRRSSCSRPSCAAVRLDLVRGHVVEPLHRITLRPRNGLRMSLSQRTRAP